MDSAGPPAVPAAGDAWKGGSVELRPRSLVSSVAVTRTGDGRGPHSAEKLALVCLEGPGKLSSRSRSGGRPGGHPSSGAGDQQVVGDALRVRRARHDP